MNNAVSRCWQAFFWWLNNTSEIALSLRIALIYTLCLRFEGDDFGLVAIMCVHTLI